MKEKNPGKSALRVVRRVGVSGGTVAYAKASSRLNPFL